MRLEPITAMENYKIFLKTQVAVYTDDKEKQKDIVEMLNDAFLDGVKYMKGNLKVEVLDDWDIEKIKEAKSNG